MRQKERYVNVKRYSILTSGGMSAVDYEGNKAWTMDGVLHRDDAPAWLSPDGYFEYWMHGEPHRTDGPACVHDGKAEWWYAGHSMDFDEWCESTCKSDREKAYLLLKYV